jgi:hypothetical protein
MYRYLLPLAFFSCGARLELPALDVDPALRPLLERYLDAAPDLGRIGALRVMKYGYPGENLVGACIEYSAVDAKGERRWSEVVIAPGIPDYMLAVIVYHELLHCVHGREHTDDPGAIMYYAPVWDEEYWEANLDQQLAAAFAEGDK